MLETIERMAAVATVRLSAQPNAGRPREIEGRNIYLCSPEYMASYARRFINNGVRLVGGCCGTTPEHIRQIKAAVRALGAGGGTRSHAGRRADRQRRRPRRRIVAGAARAEVADGQRARARRVRRQPSSCCRRAGYRADALVERRGSCGSTASIWSTSPTARAPARG